MAEYPNLVQEKRVVGQTYEGRNLYVLKVGNPRPDGKLKPAIWMDAGQSTEMRYKNQKFTNPKTTRKWLEQILAFSWSFFQLISSFFINTFINQWINEFPVFVIYRHPCERMDRTGHANLHVRILCV